MRLYELFLIGVGLSMDAFAVSICKGLSMKKMNYRQALVIGLFFGGFQALMPLVGWALGTRFESYITSIDHWIAFILLALIGANMIREAVSEGEDDTQAGTLEKLDIKEMFLLSIATSIDALAVGITFAFLQVEIIPAVSLIGCTTLVISFAGVCIGNVFGTKYKKNAEIVGGVILILIGIKILLEHLGIISF